MCSLNNDLNGPTHGVHLKDGNHIQAAMDKLEARYLHQSSVRMVNSPFL